MKRRDKRRGIGTRGKCSMEPTVLVRGDVVSVRMYDGEKDDTHIQFPERWGLLHDPEGTCFDRCEIFIAPYGQSNTGEVQTNYSVVESARSYFGNDFRLQNAVVDIPNGPWKLVGVVAQIFYDRHGELEGPYQHPIDEALSAGQRVLLYEARRRQKLVGQLVTPFRLSLPDGCVINAHGFVWP